MTTARRSSPLPMQRLLREVGARETGEKAAAEAIRFLCASGLLEDTGEVKRPRRRAQRIAAREKSAPASDSQEHGGGRDAQPTIQRSCWWRVFRIVPLAHVLGFYASNRARARTLSNPRAI